MVVLGERILTGPSRRQKRLSVRGYNRGTPHLRVRRRAFGRRQHLVVDDDFDNFANTTLHVKTTF